MRPRQARLGRRGDLPSGSLTVPVFPRRQRATPVPGGRARRWSGAHRRRTTAVPWSDPGRQIVPPQLLVPTDRGQERFDQHEPSHAAGDGGVEHGPVVLLVRLRARAGALVVAAPGVVDPDQYRDHGRLAGQHVIRPTSAEQVRGVATDAAVGERQAELGVPCAQQRGDDAGVAVSQAVRVAAVTAPVGDGVPGQHDAVARAQQGPAPDLGLVHDRRC